jgi:hypothetical protein
VQLVPVLPSERRPQFGSAKGLIVMADDFDAPLADLAVEPRTRICVPRDCSQRQSNI